ncbi:FAD-binding oxidoreductase [Novosphingobium sp. AP12]|uniref:NAD(P)/FAD-dependent oxidoreductase n=1 Tax=Novosphingobium sp. AP12 TaxID=1144305 RepID=UPI00027219FD|nr:FAD-binding oxidoreductase [Novosphingobium sp. AP12]EJL27975.1 glycine/D-amino acid oxidase, deaminating [Novosphingobium sp. AP12]
MTFQRRTVLGGMTALAALHATGACAQNRRKRVGVIGGGLIGASIAAQLAKAGADVIVFEKVRPAAGATEKSVAWINPVVNDAHYMKLRLQSMAAWLEDDRALGMKAIWGGSLSWAYSDKKDSLQKKATLLEATDDPPRYLTGAQITKAEPGILPGDGVELAFQTAKDGHVDPVFATQCYLAAAKRLGAKVLYPCEVTAIKVRGGAVVGVATTKGDFDLDHVVSVTGTDTPRIMALLDRKLELAHKPGLVVHTAPRPVTTKLVYEASSILEFKQYADGRYLTSFTSGPPNLPQHAEILQHQMAYPDPALQQRHGELLIERTAQYMPAIAGATPTKVLLGFRPYPLDNKPIAGPVPGVKGAYVVVTHSGITLAPILGRHAAQEIMTGVEAPILAPYRPTRYITA